MDFISSDSIVSRFIWDTDPKVSHLALYRPLNFGQQTQATSNDNFPPFPPVPLRAEVPHLMLAHA
jgi:hypothetical protein